MLSNKIIAVLAASSAVAVFSATATNADPIVKQEQNQLGDSAAPDVDPGASRGTDKSIVKQEQNQLGDTAAPNVPEPSMKGGQSIPSEEQKQLGN